MDNTSDSDLITQAKQDPQAFGVLYERYVHRIYRYLYYRTGNRQDAEDLTAQTFQRAMRYLPRYVDRGLPFAAWLYRIAHSVMANWRRDNSRRPVVPLEAVVVTSSQREDPHAVAAQEEEKEHLLRAMRRLPGDRQQLLILKFVEEMTNVEIGKVMGRSEGAVKSLYHRTLVALRQELVKEGAASEET